jgi:hypothetical protein
MKKLLVLALVFSVTALGVPIWAHPVPQMSQGDNTQKPPLKTIQGTVKADGEKITFVADADSKSWDVMNPETLKAHVGHHVELSAHVYADKAAIHVMNVKMLKADSK